MANKTAPPGAMGCRCSKNFLLWEVCGGGAGTGWGRSSRKGSTWGADRRPGTWTKSWLHLGKQWNLWPPAGLIFLNKNIISFTHGRKLLPVWWCCWWLHQAFCRDQSAGGFVMGWAASNKYFYLQFSCWFHQNCREKTCHMLQKSCLNLVVLEKHCKTPKMFKYQGYKAENWFPVIIQDIWDLKKSFWLINFLLVFFHLMTQLILNLKRSKDPRGLIASQKFKL